MVYHTIMGLKLTTTGKSIVEEVPYGTYLWQLPNGQYISDGEGHYLMIFAIKGDKKRIEALRKAAEDCGVTTGRAVYVTGQRPVTDEEYEEQRQRLVFGLVPDTMDLPSLLEDKKNRGK